jgi:hypothetical protein
MRIASAVRGGPGARLGIPRSPILSAAGGSGNATAKEGFGFCPQLGHRQPNLL